MIITPPPGAYFIHGLRHWSKHYLIDLVSPEISVSLQKDGFTHPIRPLGFILRIRKGGIIAAYSKDVASKVLLGKKIPSPFSKLTRRYGEDELDVLLANTPKNKHNEFWVDSDRADIVGGYTIVGSSKSFEKAMKKAGFDMHRIQTIVQD